MSATPNLSQTLPELQAAHDTLARLAAAAGIQFRLNDYGALRTASDTTDILGYRTYDYAAYVRQARAAGKTPLPITTWRPIAPWGHSYHDYGAAFDISITSKPATMTAAAALEQVGQLAPVAGLRWGASFHDPAHFELAIPLEDAATRWAEYQAHTGPYAPPVPTSITDAALQDVEQVAGSAVDAIADQANNLTGGLPPVATALLAAISLGVLGAIVARNLFFA